MRSSSRRGQAGEQSTTGSPGVREHPDLSICSFPWYMYFLPPWPISGYQHEVTEQRWEAM